MGALRLGEEVASYERWPGAARAPLPGYRRREPEKTVLHRLVRSELDTLVREARERSEHGAGLPRFVVRELEAYLGCGVLGNGFARVRCGDCAHERLVAFSCKGRGLCPSCTTRRALDTAAHLVERVIPRVLVRQWVLSFPRRIRWHLVRDPKLASAALAILLRAILAFHRRRARAAGVDGSCGSVSFLQRFGSALALNLHFHVLVPDGVFTADGFHELSPPEDDEVEALLATVARRVLRLLARRGRIEEDAEVDALGALQARSLQARLPLSGAEPPRRARRCAFLDGFSLHAGVGVHPEDRGALERLCLYGARGPLALERLSELPDGRIAYRMKRTAPDGSTHLVLPPGAFLARLAALIPPPRVHLTRFHGVFAPAARRRKEIVPTRPVPAPSPSPSPAPAAPPALCASPRHTRIPWADLLRRVYKIDVLLCPSCGGRMRVIAFLSDPKVVRQILDHLELPSSPLPRAPARDPPGRPSSW
jgi:hypothetical protein